MVIAPSRMRLLNQPHGLDEGEKVVTACPSTVAGGAIIHVFAWQRGSRRNVLRLVHGKSFTIKYNIGKETSITYFIT